MRIAAALCLSLLVAGCGSVKGPSGPDLQLSRTDYDFARALAHFSQGLIYQQELGPLSEEAREEFFEAAQLDPDRPELHTRAAIMALRQKRPDIAIDVLRDACRRNPDSAIMRVDLATALAFADDLPAALESLRDAVRLAPTNSYPYRQAARLSFQMGEDEQALDFLKQGMRRTEGKGLLGDCYATGREFVQSGETDRAVACFALVADESGENRGEFLWLLSRLYAGLGHEEQALSALVDATRADPPSPQAFVQLAINRFESDRRHAFRTLRKASRKLPQDTTVLSAAAGLYTLDGRYDRAVESYAKIADIAAQSAGHNLSTNFYLHYGAACEQAGRYDESVRIFESSLEVHPDNHPVLNYLAYMWAEKGTNLDRAEEYVRRALELEPDNGAYVDTLGWILYRQSKLELSLEQIQRARELVPDDPVIIEHMGDIYQALGNHTDAVTHWKESFRIDPDSETVAAKLKASGLEPGSLPSATDDSPGEERPAEN